MFIAIDIGGTNTRVGASKNRRSFFAIEKFKTPARFKDGIKQIVEHIRRLDLRASGDPISRHLKLRGVAVAVPSTVSNNPNLKLRFANLPGWNGVPLKQSLTTILHTEILLINDADAAAIGEARRGAGRGYGRVLYYTISTGIGGAIIINRLLDPKTPDFEPGHYTLVPHGRICGCGRRGCFEAYGSGSAFYKTYGMRTQDCKNKKIWNEYAQILGLGIIKTLPHPLPDIIVIGGGVSRVGTKLFTPLRAYIKKNLRVARDLPIVPAKLGDNAGLYGCLKLLA